MSDICVPDDIQAMLQALKLVERALLSDPPTGPQTYIVGDDMIYRLDGQTMYHALNAVRAAIAKARGQS